MSNLPKQQCSICGSPDHTHLHCYGMQAQGAISSNVRTPREHDLKVWPEFYSKLESGEKTFELRKDDRGYRAGDILFLREWNPRMEAYTGNSMRRRVTYLMSGLGLQKDFVVMALGSAVETSPQWTCSCGHVNTTPKLFMDRCSHCGEHRGSVEETSEELNCTTCGKPLDDHGGMGLPCPLSAPPEKASGEPIYECCNESCLWRGLESETVHPKHEPSRFLCPECHEVVELV